VRKVVFNEEAQEEMEEASLWYEAKKAGLGEDFLAMVEKALAEISRSPKAFGFFQKTEFRKRQTKKFPYLVIYKEREDHVWVVAVAHGKRKPGYWLRRAEDD
jgi:toxin ParE1/3/4